MNPLGVHALVWVAGWGPKEAERAITGAARAGFDHIEVPLLDPDAVDAAMTTRLLARHGIDVTCSLGLPLDADISSVDDEVVRRGERFLREAVAVTRDIGSRYLGGILYSGFGKYTRPPTASGRDHAAETLRSIAEEADRSGITLGLEPVNRYESNLLNTTAQARELIEEIGADNVVIHLDSYHAHIEETDMLSAVRGCGDLLGYVHIGENHRGYLGSGQVDFPGLFRALAQQGYDGAITFESFSSVVVSEDFIAALAIWRDQWSDSDDLAIRARRYIETQLEVAHRSVAS